MPLLVDDGTNGYLHADGLIAEISAGGAPTYHLTDALGSVRGLTDLTGMVTGTSAFDVFGAIRTQSGVTSMFGFTGEQHDAMTGMTYLRARYYQPDHGRFLSADTVQPGGPGTQGYNRYVYVGNNPCTATDPSGHCVSWLFNEIVGGIMLELAGAAMLFMYWLYRNHMRARATAIEVVKLAGEFAQKTFLLLVFCLWVAVIMASGGDGANRANPNSPKGPNFLKDAPAGWPSTPSPQW